MTPATVQELLSFPVPDNAVDRAEHFARDLAWGVANNLWSPRFIAVWNMASTAPRWDTSGPERARVDFRLLIEQKWNLKTPFPDLLIMMDYIEAVTDSRGNLDFMLTSKSLELLKKPSEPPTAFISYKRGVSSAFALLLDARIKLAGGVPFIDRNLVGGDEWHGRLKETIMNVRHFICVVNPKTLESKWVNNEIDWANEAGVKVIPVCHAGMKLESLPPKLNASHAREVKAASDQESAADYDEAVNFVVSAMFVQNPS